MHYCPYCGTLVQEEEIFCLHCGKELPKNMSERFIQKRNRFNKWWLLPVGSVLLFSLLFLGAYFLSLSEKKNAIHAYNEGIELAKNSEYENAKNSFKKALDDRNKFNAATHNYQFMDIALSIQNKLSSAKVLLEKNSFQQALSLMTQAEEQLKNYDGILVDELLDQIITTSNNIQTKELKFSLQQKPSIQDLKLLLWQSETIQSEEAKTLTNEIRNQIVDFTYSTANEALKQNQYSEAIQIIEDGLRYAPDSEKLDSLKTIVEKEKVAFETEQQQRIQQAMDAAEKEYEMNKNDAVEIISIETSRDKYGDLVVKGVLKSVATIPIYSLSVEYNLLNDDGEAVQSNIVFTYPETLYPDEEGKFEFTHYDLDQELTAKIVKVQWFLDSP